MRSLDLRQLGEIQRKCCHTIVHHRPPPPSPCKKRRANRPRQYFCIACRRDVISWLVQQRDQAFFGLFAGLRHVEKPNLRLHRVVDLQGAEKRFWRWYSQMWGILYYDNRAWFSLACTTREHKSESGVQQDALVTSKKNFMGRSHDVVLAMDCSLGEVPDVECGVPGNCSIVTRHFLHGICDL